MRFFIILGVFFSSFNLAIGQRFMEDSAFQKIDFYSLDTLGKYDTTDIMEGDYYDTGMDLSAVSIIMADWTKYWCRRKEHITANRDIDLRKHQWNYIRIFHDDFDAYDKSFWQNTTNNGAKNWDYFVDNGEPCKPPDGHVIGLNLNENERCENGKLLISVKYDPITIPWNYNSHQYDPNSWVTTTRTFDYRTARVESAWGFDGSMDILYNSDGTTSLSEDEGGICIVSKIKHPNEAGLIPAYWLM